MPSDANTVRIACAGAGKTTHLVSRALAIPQRRVAIVTYTHNNVREVTQKFEYLNSGIPGHVEVMTWFGFLLRECARPYQEALCHGLGMESILFVNKQSARGIPESNTLRHYFLNRDLIYSDKIAKFVVKCEEASAGALTTRLAQVFDEIYIDEFQDLAGWDLDVIEMLLTSGPRVLLVGDPRQTTYRTNQSQKNRQYYGVKITDKVAAWCRAGLCVSETMSSSFRCNEGICTFANNLWPNMAQMSASQHETTGHDGVFLVAENQVTEYVQRFRPQVLRWDKRADTYGCAALNFGQVKGRQFDRVLIVPTSPFQKYLSSGNVGHVAKSQGTREKLHVAVTRARHSVAFVFDRCSPVVANRWPNTGLTQARLPI